MAVIALMTLGGCATHPINPPIAQVDPNRGYRYLAHRAQHGHADRENLVILAFSGGGTRAAAFSYGVLEALRGMELTGPTGRKVRVLDEVDLITGVSGGSFTALAYGLYGEKLFEIYETSFLKRNVQGELIARVLNPVHWGPLASETWGRSELAAQLYDEILFHGATYADLDHRSGPFIAATATEIASGTRFGFDQDVFDHLCSDVDAVPLSRAAAASSAVPFVLTPVTINNYGGSCQFAWPSWAQPFIDDPPPTRTSARINKQLQNLHGYQVAGPKSFVHLVDGGLADNLAMRSVLEAMEGMEALYFANQPTPLRHIRRVIVFVVNSHSSPETHWNEAERAPGNVALLIRAMGVPINHYSYEAVEMLKDTRERWQNLRRIRDSPIFVANKDAELARMVSAPSIDIYAIDVSFATLTDKAEYEYLNELPTTLALPSEAVDRLRSAAGTIIYSSPEFQRLLKDVGAKLVVGQ
jgi:NTE family protein